MVNPRKTLGLELSESSVSWALVQENEKKEVSLIDSGCRQFKGAFEFVKGRDLPTSKVRTEKRGIRKQLRRKRARKADLLLVLMKYDLCPNIGEDVVLAWKQKKLFPKDSALMDWLNVNAKSGKNPYSDRHECLHRKLDLTKQEDRYILGRALYHLNQHRGYISNAIDEENEDTKTVKKGILELTENMLSAGTEFLGDYFYSIFNKERIRGRYIGGKEHIIAEFDEICRVQELPTEIEAELYGVIFRRLPQKSTGGIGKCVYTGKQRCNKQHPDFEEYRMLEFLQNVKVASLYDPEFRSLTKKQKEAISYLFFRRSKPTFQFSEIASVLSGVKISEKKASGRCLGDYRFNYSLETPVSGCPTTATIIAAIGAKTDGSDWRQALAQKYRRNKNEEDALADLWHTLVFFDDKERKYSWFVDEIGADDAAAKMLSKIIIKADYAMMSLGVIKKCLVFLRKGYCRSTSVFLANLDKCVPAAMANAEQLSDIVEDVTLLINQSNAGEYEGQTKEALIKNYLGGIEGAKPDNLWEPSQSDDFAPMYRNEIKILGSPFTNSLRNPLVIRTLCQMRAVINALLLEGKIDSDTTIRLSMTNKVNTRNMREAIRLLDLSKMKENLAFKKEIADLKKISVEDVREEDLKIYRLWIEQRHIDPYSGKTIAASAIFTGGYILDNIIPMSLGGSDKLENLVLTSKDNAAKRQGKLLIEVFDEKELSMFIEKMGWNEERVKFEHRMFGAKKSVKSASTFEAKGQAQRDAHINRMQASYYEHKIKRMLTDKPFDDSKEILNGQYGSIGRYATKFLSSVFSPARVYTTSEDSIKVFRCLWGCDNQYEDYADSVVNAITVACIDKGKYDAYCKYRKDFEKNHGTGKTMKHFDKPWITFVEDVDIQAKSLVSSLRQAAPLIKKSRRNLRDDKGELIRGKDGNPITTGKFSVRGSLHRDTFYGVRDIDGENVLTSKVGIEEIKKVESIVDPTIRKIVSKAVQKYGSIEKALKAGPIVYNGSPIRRVRVKSFFKNPIMFEKNGVKKYVVNDENYCMIIKGAGKDMEVRTVSNLEVVRNGGNVLRDGEIALTKKLRVILYENDKRELLSLSKAELSSRLYSIEGFGEKILYFRHHCDKNSQLSNGWWTAEAKENPLFFKKTVTSINFIVEGVDFTISTTGKLDFLYE